MRGISKSGRSHRRTARWWGVGDPPPQQAVPNRWVGQVRRTRPCFPRPLAIFLAATLGIVFPANAARQLVVVTGAGGEPGFTAEFQRQAAAWTDAATAADMDVRSIPDTPGSRGELESALRSLPKDGGDLWLVLLGHGTFDGRNAKFNLAGDDVSARELADWLQPFSRRVIVLALFSASGPFVPELSGANRIVLAATRSGGERNYSRLGEKFPESLAAADADLDGDRRTSLLELAIHASNAVTKFYEDEQRLVPEHAILDDNGDDLGTEVRELAKTRAGAGRDGLTAAEVSFAAGNLAPDFTANEIAERDRIESAVAQLRARKPDLEENAYYDELEQLLLQMAALYERARQRTVE